MTTPHQNPSIKDPMDLDRFSRLRAGTRVTVDGRLGTMLEDATPDGGICPGVAKVVFDDDTGENDKGSIPDGIEQPYAAIPYSAVELGDMLIEYSFDNSNRRISGLTMMVADGDLELSPPYQRGIVWDHERRLLLLKSIAQSRPIQSVYLNRPADSAPYNCIDGKQRISTMIAFFNDEFAIPAAWVRPDLRHGRVIPNTKKAARDKTEVVFSDLLLRGQGKFTDHGVAVHETIGLTLAEEKELFDTVNFGGVPQDPAIRGPLPTVA